MEKNVARKSQSNRKRKHRKDSSILPLIREQTSWQNPEFSDGSGVACGGAAEEGSDKCAQKISIASGQKGDNSTAQELPQSSENMLLLKRQNEEKRRKRS